MKNRLPVVLALAAFAVSGCSQKASAPTGTAGTTASAPTAGPHVVELTAGDAMKFNLTTIEAKAGEQLTVTLTNNGTQPKEVMGHNWVLLKAGSDAAAFSAAGVLAKDTDYLPPALKDQVIANIATLGPRKTGEVTFTVPGPGEYPFLCSFPAHYAIGMKGTLIVK